MRLRYLVCLAALVACKKGVPADEAELAVTRTIAGDALVTIERSLAEAHAKSPTRTPATGFDSCAVAIPTIPRLRASADVMLANKLDELCHHELPVAELTAAVALVEEDATACSRTRYAITARTLLERAGRLDDDATKLVARYDALCPKP